MKIGQARCPHCGNKFTTGGIVRHVKSCKAKPEETPAPEPASISSVWNTVLANHHEPSATIEKFSDLLGHTIKEINVSSSKDRIIFTLNDGSEYLLYHSQDCCESVSIEDIAGDLSDLTASPLTMAEETISNENPADIIREYEEESFTWTFYRLATVKGYVTIRWYGSSNGYYSESVDFCKV